ncbi:MAG: hypothetical protein PUJ51_24285 [Clostridiales bacterium]|uniref:hypothetical protein n=1 Tax=Terrisporobacter sp. TaxID=1965305 RepID=UPI002A53F7F1|nr:hypothetical protein [Terrisporobacter sp.]MDD7757573.1 hypothetical protein [Clostridiales bacterium]MDY4137630.1 hypothetical protein [Terrisporobacter sp.]
MMYRAFINPNLVRIFGYSSRNQQDKKAYIDLLDMRIKAKHNQLSDDFLKPLGLTNDDLKVGLKLPLNAYTGTLRAPFNPLYDNLCGFSICITGQLLILQLIHDLQKIPTLEMVEANTDAVEFYIDTYYVKDAEKVLQEWQDYTGLELEKDDVVKIIARDVNNFVEIVRIGDNDYDVHYKGSLFTGKHNFVWNKELKKFEYSFKDDLKSNSLTICAEAILKNLLFGVPVEDTINKCDDIFRFQMISHLGSTYEKCVLEYPDGVQEELQRNNRIYAGITKNDCKIYKIKGDRKDSLANCPPNPIVDNKNEISIEMVNKKWYIKYAKQKISDFVGRKDIYMEEKLEKLKKDELIEMIKKSKPSDDTAPIGASDNALLAQKIQKLRKAIRERNFILDKELPKNLGGGEVYSIEQIYTAIQEECYNVGLDFAFEVVDLIRFDIKAFTPMTGAPQHIATIKCQITLTDIDSGCNKVYTMISQGSDSIDKAVNAASTYALRNWFNKTFTPCIFNGVKSEFTQVSSSPVNIDANVNDAQLSNPTNKTFVAPAKKENIVKEITKEPQKDATSDDFDEVVDLIHKLRELTGNPDIGQKTMNLLIDGNISDVELLNTKLKLENAIADEQKKRA